MKIKNLKLKIVKKAFTLVEMLTVVFLGMLIIVAAYTVYLMSYKSYNRHFESSELTQNARIALERMSRDLRQASDIVTVLPDSQTGTPPSEIMFQDGHDLLTDPPPLCTYQYITYKISSGDLIRELASYYLTDPNTCVKYDPTQTLNKTLLSSGVKAQKITKLQFWGVKPTVTIYLEVSNSKSTYKLETKTTARNM